ncbi:MAG: CBS domain-containing protein [Roseiflexaceae bacterium]|nr:CBS domain-containing protein [Roseiflexaceae bacterium]
METSVRRLLEERDRVVWTVSPDMAVIDALQYMADKDVGALLVVEDDQLVGIVTERDYARKVILAGRSSRDTQVRVIMTSDVIVISSDRTMQECMRIMTERHLRHLPVVDDGRVLGVLSIRDVVAHLVRDQEFMIEQLTNYIST